MQINGAVLCPLRFLNRDTVVAHPHAKDMKRFIASTTNRSSQGGGKEEEMVRERERETADTRKSMLRGEEGGER